MFAIRPLLVASLLTLSGLAQAGIPATLYKSPGCSCCEEYVSYLSRNGFDVKPINHDDMNAIKQQHHVGRLTSCHTTLIGGYTVEGHVPVAAIRKLLRDKPAIAGISVPGMPSNSPGMGQEKPGTLAVYMLGEQAQPRVFSVE